jgi:hypothetical protein
MSTRERTRLADWITELVGALDRDRFGAGRRLRQVVDGYQARIVLDGEAVLVSMDHDEIDIGPDDPDAAVDGWGSTTTEVVLAILAADIEVAEAVERGQLEVVGSTEAVSRMFHAIELLLDGSARVPELRRLAARFIDEAGPKPLTATAPTSVALIEEAMLQRLGLLNGE